MAPTRDYYADLELPPTADIQEVKKQFRKLALKYHPDRNPGREEEVNSKFQVIQSAHEVLTDPQEKAKYDATLGRSSRYAGASGVKGNPWQNVSQQFPTPPRRNAASRNATSGAQRWQSRFSNGVPPTARQQATPDSEAKKYAARAFDNMRKTQFQGSTKGAQRETRPPPPPPPPPPRTESARQRAQASFGARKPGFQPRSGVPGDETPVSSQNYYSKPSTVHPQAPNPPPRQAQPARVPDPLSQFRDYADSRQSTPYSAHGGEKTNPFDGVPLARAKSTRETGPRHEPSTSDEGLSRDQKHRSSSIPKPASHQEAGSGPSSSQEDHIPPHRAEEMANDYTNTSFRSRDKAKSNHRAAQDSATHDGQGPNTEKRPKPGGRSGSAPSMYDTPRKEQSFSHSTSATYGTNHPSDLNSARRAKHFHASACNYESSDTVYPRLDPSGNQKALHSLASFEKQQHLILDRLINNMGTGLQRERKRARHVDSTPDSRDVTEIADTLRVDSFNFAVGDNVFEQTSAPPDPSRFAKASLDDINTRFVNEDESRPWLFSAGSGEQGDHPTSRPPSGGGRASRRRSPVKRPTMRQTDSTERPPQTETCSSGFNADGWSDKFGPQTFVPQPAPGTSSSPTRSTRPTSKKARARPTVGNAAIVDDGSSDEETYEWRGRNAQTKSAAADTPQAMDIDSPPRDPAVPPAAQASSARNIPVEPSRPEWRSGDVNSMTEDAKPELPAKIPFSGTTGGSEDSEEFKASFADFKNVAPFSQPAVGLRSFEDLKDNLPFESKASEDIPIRLPKAQTLVFPTPPEAPRLPPTVAVEGITPNAASWVKYLADFESYLQKWDEFNGQVVDHFATRKAHITRIRSSKGYAFLGARGNGDVQEYYNWVQQDNDVRRRWNTACEDHEKRFREYMAFREQMK